MGMAVTLADRQHSGNDPRRKRILKRMLGFGAILFATFFRNRGNASNGSTPHTCQDLEADARKQKFGRPKNCTLPEGNKTKE